MRFLTPILMILALACPSATRADGLLLYFGDCLEAEDATWSCSTNSGTAFTLVAAVVSPAGLQHLMAQESVLEVFFPAAVPDWWRIGAGLCRPSDAMTVSFDGTPFSCLDYFRDAGVLVGSAAWTIGPDPAVGDPEGPIGSNEIRIGVTSGIDSVAAMFAIPPAGGDMVFLFSLTVTRSLASGSDACAGCATPGWIRFLRSTLRQPAGYGDAVLTNDACDGCSSFQGADPRECLCAPATRSTWGQLKALYR